MRLTPVNKVVFIFIVTILALFVSLPKEFPLSIHWKFINIEKSLTRPIFKKEYPLILGLDLAGGSHLVFEVDTKNLDKDEKKAALESLKEVMERRVNLFGVSEPNIQLSSFEGKDRVIVELPGVKDTSEAINIIGQTAQLVFGELIGEGEEAVLQPTELTGADLKRVRVSFDPQTGNPGVSLEFTTEGGEKFANITQRNIGKVIPIILDGQVISSPIVQDKITGGTAQISGNFSTDEAESLAVQLNAGALPLGVNLIEQRTIGAGLGAESVKKSVGAGATGLLMVMIFMVLSYGKFGLVANVALLIFGILTMALYKVIPIVLTLPGIAGFLLSVGMAVDSNILIFERFKEEIKRREFNDALEVSFGRAWDSIRDANIATLITAFILANPLDFPFLHSSGPVRGFAITLTLGILISLFTGIVVSRNLLRVFATEKKK